MFSLQLNKWEDGFFKGLFKASWQGSYEGTNEKEPDVAKNMCCTLHPALAVCSGSPLTERFLCAEACQAHLSHTLPSQLIDLTFLITKYNFIIGKPGSINCKGSVGDNKQKSIFVQVHPCEVLHQVFVSTPGLLRVFIIRIPKYGGFLNLRLMLNARLQSCSLKP